MNTRKVVLLLLCAPAALVLLLPACRKLTQTSPAQDLLTMPRVFSNDAGAEAAMAGIYIDMMDIPRTPMNAGISLDAGLSSDELDCQLPPFPQEDSFRLNMLTAGNLISTSLFTDAYSLIYGLNSMLAGMESSTGMTAAVKSELTGEAEFNRAFLYFYLVNLYGGVPLVLETNFMQTQGLPRAPVDSIYARVVSDLEDAQARLPAAYIDAAGFTGDRTRPNAAAATAMLARVWLYLGNWASADSAATAVIDNTQYTLETNLDNVFLSVSQEAIWQLQGVRNPIATADASIYLVPPGRPTFVLTSNLLGAFETGDLRQQHWTKTAVIGGITYTYPYKYKLLSAGVDTEYEMALRLAEQYLIRAEAEAQEGNLSGAIADVNIIRNRAGLPNSTTAMTTAAVMAAVMQERRIELMTEWGHRWLDLKRTDQADAVLSSEKTWWVTSDQLYPIPTKELLADPGMLQNPGY